MRICVYLFGTGMKETDFSLSVGMYKVRRVRGSFTYRCLKKQRRAVVLPKRRGKRRRGWKEDGCVRSVPPSHSQQGGGWRGPPCPCKQLPPLPGAASGGTRAGAARTLSCHQWRASALIS